MSSTSAESPPIPNSYWVQPGRLAAGEYPGSMSRAEAMARVQRLLHAGITSFIDLTEEGELPAYDHLLAALGEQSARYRRLPILDHALPESPAYMGRILDVIDGELAAGRRVYVHCHAGIGRTGMTIGCHLVRGGLTSEEALSRLQVLWQQCGRSRRWPQIPETPEQIEFVRQWSEPAQPAGPATDVIARCEGAFVGLAVGDAFGALVAGGGPDAAAPAAGGRDGGMIEPGADAATARALAESLVARSGHDPADQMQRYLQWSRSAAVSVPADLKRALAAWQWSRKPNAGSHDPKNLDPHSLARTLAAAMFRRTDAQGAIDLAAEVSRTTQQSPVVLDLCRLWAALFVDALSGAGRECLLAFDAPAMQTLRRRALKPAVCEVIDGRPGQDAPGASDAIAVTRSALDAFSRTTTLRDALLDVKGSLRAASTAAALCGALAGAHYGIEAIPLEWRRRLAEDAALRGLARRLLG